MSPRPYPDVETPKALFDADAAKKVGAMRNIILEKLQYAEWAVLDCFGRTEDEKLRKDFTNVLDAIREARKTAAST